MRITNPVSTHGHIKTFFLKAFATLLLMFFIHGSTLSVANAQTSHGDTQEPDEYVQVRIVPEKTHINAGETILIAFEQKIYENWHTYWKNPGDSGSATALDWSLPEGFEIGEIMWPAPSRIAYGPLMNFGYSNEAVLLQTLTAPINMPDGPVNFSVDYEILVCHEICIPEIGTLNLTLNDGETVTSNEDYINEKHMQLPFPLKWDAQYKEENEQLVIDINVAKPALIAQNGDQVKFDFFPEEWGYIENPAVVDATFNPPRSLQIKIKRGERELETQENLDFVLSYTKDGDDTHAIKLSAQADQNWLAGQQSSNNNIVQETGPASNTNTSNTEGSLSTINLPSITVAQAILYALLGGLVLNLMPCVFPILSMKALHFSEAVHAGDTHTKIHGLAYTAGILLCFGGLAGTLIALQAAGAQVGWGFQLQNPVIILGLVFLFYLVGLSLSGFFEIQTKLSNAGSSLTSRKGASGSFFTGILATIVATPCTAPFMGVAIGFALTQPPYVSLTIFLALGLGLALPFLILSFIPSLHKVFPRPGAWMVIFKEFLAFPIYLSVVWLIWVFIQQTGTLGVLYALGGIVGISFGVWLLNKGVNKFIAIGVIIITILLPFSCGCFMKAGTSPALQISSKASQSFSTQTLMTALDETDEAVFVNMTAAWCITCKVNERVALSSDEFHNIIKEKNITYIKGDWTNYDPEITEFLDHYGRSGVPIYVYYGARNDETGKRPEAVVLPQILTPNIVRNALSQ